jgi:hypothetical protein
MKPFKSIIVVKHPRDLVWKTILDRLPDLVPYLDDIDTVTTQDRQELPDGVVQLVNIWKADIQIPAALHSIINPSMLAWTDRAQWRQRHAQCHWSIEPHFFPERIRCAGVTHYESAIGGRGTRITFEGQLEVSAHKLAGMPAFMGDNAGKAIEFFVTSLIPKNFRKITDALGVLLDKEA